MNLASAASRLIVNNISQNPQGALRTNRVTFFGIGEPLPFSFLGISIALVVFLVVLVFVTAIKEIIEAQDVVW